MKGVFSLSILLFFVVTASSSPVDRFNDHDDLDDDFLNEEDDVGPDGSPNINIVSNLSEKKNTDNILPSN